jgi:hypothetical protein
MNATTTQTATQAQIDRCHRIETSKEVFYQVESQTTAGQEYEVHYIKHGFTCTCPAGNPPVDANGAPKYAPRACWHIRAAVAHAKEFKQLARIASLESLGLTHVEAVKAVTSNARINGKAATDEELVRIFQTVARPTEAQINADYEQYQSRAFSLMR